MQNENIELKRTVKKSHSLLSTRNSRIETHQNKIKNHFCPIGSTAELVDFVTKHAGLCRHNMSNDLHHKENSSAALQMFGFQSFGETLHCLKAFFTKVDIIFPSIFYEGKKIRRHRIDFWIQCTEHIEISVGRTGQPTICHAPQT